MLPAHNLVFGESEESRAAKRNAGRVWKGGQRQIIGMLLCVCVCAVWGSWAARGWRTGNKEGVVFWKEGRVWRGRRRRLLATGGEGRGKRSAVLCCCTGGWRDEERSGGRGA